jgi:hypothetical protein
MRMKQRGVAPVVVVIVIIVVAVVAVGAVLLLRGGGGPGGLPEYPGSQGYDIPQEYLAGFGLPAGVEMKAYTVSGASVQDVVNWYKGQMTGWTLVEEVPLSSMMGYTYGALVYSKGDQGAEIIAVSGIPGIEGTAYVLATGPLSAFQ